jgi:hypothetical protein
VWMDCMVVTAGMGMWEIWDNCCLFPSLTCLSERLAEVFPRVPEPFSDVPHS